jgi:hypothetical protein
VPLDELWVTGWPAAAAAAKKWVADFAELYTQKKMSDACMVNHRN